MRSGLGLPRPNFEVECHGDGAQDVGQFLQSVHPRGCLAFLDKEKSPIYCRKSMVCDGDDDDDDDDDDDAGNCSDDASGGGIPSLKDEGETFLNGRSCLQPRNPSAPSSSRRGCWASAIQAFTPRSYRCFGYLMFAVLPSNSIQSTLTSVNLQSIAMEKFSDSELQKINPPNHRSPATPPEAGFYWLKNTEP